MGPSDNLTARAVRIIERLRIATHGMVEPMVEALIDRYGRDPFIILISCLLSLRSKDTVTHPVSLKLFSRARTPQELLAIPRSELEILLHPLGFYRRKAATLHEVARDLLDRFDGQVPATEAELLSIKGVGRKTANLVLGKAFGIPAICVDTHVHRLANEFGLVSTKTPEQTERELQKIVPKQYWIEINRLFIKWGRTWKKLAI